MWVWDFDMCECLASSGSRPARLTNNALLAAVDYGLLALGEVVRATIYTRIEERYQVKREEIPEKLDTFHKALQELLGGGAEILKRLIVKSLYSTLKLKLPENESWTFVEYVQNAKTQLTIGEPERTDMKPANGATTLKTSIDFFANSTPARNLEL